MSEQKAYDPEMRGALYEEVERKSEKSPIATGKITISGVELRIAMWPSQVTKGDAKKKYWPVKVEYRQGATRFLAPVSPASVTVTAATSAAEPSALPDAPGDDPTDVGDMPF
jgi:hypothetical protein